MDHAGSENLRVPDARRLANLDERDNSPPGPTHDGSGCAAPPHAAPEGPEVDRRRPSIGTSRLDHSRFGR